MSRIYLSAPHMGELEQTFVREAFESNWLSAVGPHVDAFESEFEARIGLPSVALSSGTAAMHLGLRLLGVQPGDVVLCPTLTFVATANPIVYLGATPHFVDSERASWNLDPSALADAITVSVRRGQRPRCVIVVHLFGQSADLDAIEAVCQRYDIPILEDAAEAAGTLYRGVPVGTRAPVSAFSFNGNKIITTTSGGMLVAKDRDWARKAKHWSTQARDPGIAYEHSELGYNYRMSNVLAGIGRGQLRVLDERVAQRRAIAFRYREALEPLEGLTLMPQADWGLHTNWLSVFLVDEAKLGCSRDDLIAALAAEDIEARPVWKPLHLQRLYANAPRTGGAVSEDLFARGICLPSTSSMPIATQDRVIEVMRQRVSSSRARHA